MKEETGQTYKPASNMIKLLAAADAKDGKTTNLIAGVLGLQPHQTRGGVVSSPQNLHIIACDTAALDKVREFLTDHCGATEADLQYKVYNMEEDYSKAFENQYDFANGFYNTLLATIDKIKQRVAAQPGQVSVVIFSSITTIARALLRGIQGGIKDDDSGKSLKKSTMDMNKWSMVSMQLNELQATGQGIKAHVIWEGHLAKKIDAKEKDDKGKPVEKDGIAIPGAVGESWAANVSHPMVLVRQKGICHPGTKVDKTYFDTAPNLKMFGVGRGAATHLNKQEPDITIMLEKLGYPVGNYGCDEVEEPAPPTKK